MDSETRIVDFLRGIWAEIGDGSSRLSKTLDDLPFGRHRYPFTLATPAGH